VEIEVKQLQWAGTLRYELRHGELGVGWESSATQAGLHAGCGKPRDDLDHLLGQVGVSRSAPLGTAG
jgi:hypothetical protein